MELHKGYGISNSIPKGVSTRTRFRIKRLERKVHEATSKIVGVEVNKETHDTLYSDLQKAIERYSHLLEGV